jgi:CBS domain-containing protein
MNSISSILARKGNDTVSVSPHTTVLDALRIMAEKNIGSVMVIDNGAFVGIVSERDYSRKVILKGKHSHDTLVSEIMSSELPTVTPKDSVEYCMSLMTKNTIRYVPVFEGGKLAGIISMSDVVRETILSQKETINQLESYIHGQG